ncbi:MAG: phosphatase PAP2 family protein [Bdellovibrionota bacterium]
MSAEGRKFRLDETLPISLLVGLAFVICYGGSNYLASLSGQRYHVHLPAELGIPFVPAFAPMYLSVQLMLCSLLLFFRDGTALKPVAAIFLFELLTASVVFIVCPAELGFPPSIPSEAWNSWFRLADTLNLDYNLVPSLHVSFAFTAAELVAGRASFALGALYRLWAGAIALSTLLLHQHHVIDVFTGILLAYVSTKVVYQPSEAL